jgi:site-specific DNA-methyltransferase (adenine-specific)
MAPDIPTGKPVALFEYLVRTYSNPGDLVMDNCMGSGTAAVACLVSKRQFIGIEMGQDDIRRWSG